MNNSVTKETVLRRLRSGEYARLSDSEALAGVLVQHSAEIWSALATKGDAPAMEWAWERGARFGEADGTTFLVQTLLQKSGDALIETANWWRDHGAALPPAPPPATETVSERQLTTDSLWRRVIDKNPDAITWLAAQGLPVQFDRPEAGGVLSHAVHSHKLNALPVLERLLEAGAEVNVQDTQGENVCHALARLHVEKDQEPGYNLLWSRLLAVGANPHAVNHADETALDLLTEEQLASVTAVGRVQLAQDLEADAPVSPRRLRTRRS